MATAVTGQGPAMDPSNITATHPFTCNTCQVAFRGSEAQREHMRSDWHRYNLKRRVAALPPASADTFSKLVLSKQASQMEAARKATFEQSCAACQKVYKSENAFQEHLSTQRHRQKEALYRKIHGDETNSVATGAISTGTFSLGETASVTDGVAKVTAEMKRATVEDKEEGKEDHENEQMEDAKPVDPDFPLTHCLFCNAPSDDLALNHDHMSRVHGMFVPEKQYLVDPAGLIKYLYAKITENFECLYCHKLKYSAPAIQTHMRDKGHCMIAFDTEEEMLEVGQFYDFSSTYSDDEDADGDEEIVDAEDNDQEGWETDGDDESDDEAPRQNVYATDTELRLPTGRLAGHRSLAKYYRQNLRNYPTQEERIQRQRLLLENSPDEATEDTRRDPHSRAVITRANGGLGMIHASDTQKREVAAAEKRQQNRERRVQRQYQWGVEKRANNQKHFRDPLLQ